MENGILGRRRSLNERAIVRILHLRRAILPVLNDLWGIVSVAEGKNRTFYSF